MSLERATIDPAVIGERLPNLAGIGTLRAALSGEEAYLVGGAVRDLLLGVDHPDLDVVVVGDVAALATKLGAVAQIHERFATATVDLEGTRVDLATARSETYARPGALPEIEPAPLERDLARRDFTVNAMAVSLAGEPELIDPHAGVTDLRAGLLRVLHPASFVDDPTRALRAARYAARFGLELAPQTADLLQRADLGTVSHDRVEAELRRTAAAPQAATAFGFLALWKLAGVDSGAPGRIKSVEAVLAEPAWERISEPAEAIFAVARPDPELEAVALRLSSAHPERPSKAVALARGRSPIELVIGRAAGAVWLDDFVREWRHVRLEIDGADLIEAGVEQGPAVGSGLTAALDAKLDGEIDGREAELRIALAAASS